MQLATELRKYATETGGREQLAIQAFADTLEIVPRTLSESAGMDVIDTLVELRTRHKRADGRDTGVDVYNSKIADMKKLGVIEPTKVKTQAIASASEAATMLLRIDDMISAKARMPAGGPGGPGGMPGGMGGGDYE
jgi:chaperonin GroEL (HSP60 family)